MRYVDRSGNEINMLDLVIYDGIVLLVIGSDEINDCLYAIDNTSKNKIRLFKLIADYPNYFKDEGQIREVEKVIE